MKWFESHIQFNLWIFNIIFKEYELTIFDSNANMNCNDENKLDKDWKRLCILLMIFKKCFSLKSFKCKIFKTFWRLKTEIFWSQIAASLKMIIFCYCFASFILRFTIFILLYMYKKRLTRICASSTCLSIFYNERSFIFFQIVINDFNEYSFCFMITFWVFLTINVILALTLMFLYNFQDSITE